jgi:hypothetical protein
LYINSYNAGISNFNAILNEIKEGKYKPLIPREIPEKDSFLTRFMWNEGTGFPNENWGRILRKYIPDPNLTYVEIPDNYKPVTAFRAIQAWTYDEIKKGMDEIREGILGLSSLAKREDALQCFQDMILDGFTINYYNDALFIMVYNTSKKEDTIYWANRLISRFLSKDSTRSPQTRTSSWKYYLFIYDHRGKVRKEKLAEYLFPTLDNSYEQGHEGNRKVERYYKTAKKLIEGGFRKYL